MKYRVSSKIPAPPKRTRTASYDPHSFLGQIRALKVGQSILVNDRPQADCGSAGSMVARQIGQTYTTRTVKGGVRIWRVS